MHCTELVHCITGLQNVAVAVRLYCFCCVHKKCRFCLQRKWPQLMVIIRVLLYLPAKRWWELLIAVDATHNTVGCKLQCWNKVILVFSLTQQYLFIILMSATFGRGPVGSVVLKVLRYKSEGPGNDSRRRRVFSVASDSSTCPGVDSASKNDYQVNPGGKGGRCPRLTIYHLRMPMSRNLGALTSWNPLGLFRPVMGQLYLFHFRP
jgi:hypothetical protein